MAFDLPKLPYALDALEPVLSRQQVDLHYNVHTAKYFDTLNKLVKGTIYDSSTDVADLINKDTLAKMDSKLFNNACQAWNHDFYWNCLVPKDRSGNPSDALVSAIIDEFDSVEAFKKKFTEQAIDAFGSGWVWLIYRGDKLAIKTTPNARNPVTEQHTTVLLTIDVWEHAYYVTYPADRKAYINKIWDIINWDFVNKNFEKAIA